MKTPEGYVKDDIKKYLKSIGAYVFVPTQTGFGQQTLDILACVNGFFIAIEVKREGKVEPTPRQAVKIREISDAHGLAFTTDSVERTRKFIEDHCLGAYQPDRD